MKVSFLSFLLLFGALLPVRAEEAQTEAAERSARAKQATELRLAYAHTAEYNPYDRTYQDHAQAAMTAHKNGDLTKAISEIHSGLKYSKYDIEMLMFLSFLHEEKGEKQNADEVRKLWTSLLDSIFDSGTGQDYANAFTVINVAEEYAVLRALRLKKSKQSLRVHEGHEYDVFEVEDPRSGRTIELFFNIDLPKKWLSRSFSEPLNKE